MPKDVLEYYVMELSAVQQILGRDAVLGKGVYLTSLPPWTPDSRLLKNNWDSASERRLLSKLEYLDFYIEFDSKDLPDLKRSTGRRDVWMVPYDIELEILPHAICMRGRNVRVAQSLGFL
jgi:hypothetical protein